MGAMLTIKNERSGYDVQFAIKTTCDAWELARILLANRQVTEINISLYGEDLE